MEILNENQDISRHQFPFRWINSRVPEKFDFIKLLKRRKLNPHITIKVGWIHSGVTDQFWWWAEVGPHSNSPRFEFRGWLGHLSLRLNLNSRPSVLPSLPETISFPADGIAPENEKREVAIFVRMLKFKTEVKKLATHLRKGKALARWVVTEKEKPLLLCDVFGHLGQVFSVSLVAKPNGMDSGRRQVSSPPNLTPENLFLHFTPCLQSAFRPWYSVYTDGVQASS